LWIRAAHSNRSARITSILPVEFTIIESAEREKYFSTDRGIKRVEPALPLRTLSRKLKPRPTDDAKVPSGKKAGAQLQLPE
jgi:hypothetical protein